MSFTNAEKLACVARELSLRFRVYERLVAKGKMTPAKRLRELQLMEAVVDDYATMVAADEPDLFAKPGGDQ